MAEGSPDQQLGLIQGDARKADELLADIARRINPQSPKDPFLTVTLTSPPYASLINYRVEEQIGFGQTWDEYLNDCRKLFATLYRWTRSDGSLWLVADTFLEESRGSRLSHNRPTKLKTLPFELASAAEESGWFLREVVIWHKDRTLPWSGRGRLRNAFEYLLLLVKTNSYQYHLDRLRDQTDFARWWVRYPERYNPLGIAPDNVWHIPIPVQGSWRVSPAKHDCPFPPELVRRVLQLSSEANDVIFDPFAGSGTVLAVAEAMGRRALGVELNEEFVRAYYGILRPQISLQWAGGDEETSSPEVATTIWKLRALKYPRVMLGQLRTRYPDLPYPSLVAALIEELDERKAIERITLSVTVIFVLRTGSSSEREDVRSALKDICERRPLSKFRVSSDIRVVDEFEFRRLVSRRQLYLYEHGHFWNSSGRVTSSQALGLQVSRGPGRHAPLLSNVEVKVHFPEND